MKRIIFSGIFSLVAAGGALAADLAPAPAPAPPSAPASYQSIGETNYNWAGIYIGVNSGYGFGRTTWSTSAFSGTSPSSGFIGGGTLGVNFQASHFVFGLETDLDYSAITSDNSTILCTTASIAVGCQTKSDWLGTARGRAGLALDRVLFFAAGGGAYGNVQAVDDGVSNAATRVGWTAGGGIEVAVAEWNWTAKVEYLYVDLAGATCTTACGSPPGPAFNVGLTESLVRAGLNYKFSF